MRSANVVFSGPQTRAARSAPPAAADAVSGNGLSLETRPAGADIIVLATGRVTVDSSPRLRAVLRDAIGAGVTGISIDFSGTSYLDTSAVATLLEAATLASKRCVLRVIGLHGDARVVAESVELDRIFAALGYEVQFA